MAVAGEVLRRNFPENVDISDGSSSGEIHVLAVDDSLVDRKVIERLLKISSCKVTAVESGTRALQYLGLDGEKSSVGFDVSNRLVAYFLSTTMALFGCWEKEGNWKKNLQPLSLKVNLIMTDYSMPGMTGYELLKRIKESSAFREVPVVIMSSENILTRIDRCLEEGAEEFIVKPVKLSDVKRLTNFIMKGEGKEDNGGGNRINKRKLKVDISPLSSPSPSPSPPLSSPVSAKLQPAEQLPSSPSSPSSHKCSLKRPRLQHN